MTVYINPQDAARLGLMKYHGASSEEMARGIREAIKRYEATHPQEKPRTGEGKLAKKLVCAPSVR